jgi:hypothetical protein
VSLLLALLLAVTAAAAPAAPSPASSPASSMDPIYAKGETLDYTLTWMKVTGGTARMTISPAGDSLYRITSVARSGGGIARLFKIRDEIETTVDRSDFSTVSYIKRLDERGDKMVETTIIADGVATRTRKKVKKIPVSRPIFDPISVIYYFRTLELAPGKSYELNLISDGKLYTVHARVVRRESVQTPAGTFNALLVEPQMASGGVQREERLFIWYTDDERHLPVRIRTEVKFGSVTATLKSVAAGVSSTDPAPLSRSQLQ